MLLRGNPLSKKFREIFILIELHLARAQTEAHTVRYPEKIFLVAHQRNHNESKRVRVCFMIESSHAFVREALRVGKEEVVYGFSLSDSTAAKRSTKTSLFSLCTSDQLEVKGFSKGF